VVLDRGELTLRRAGPRDYVVDYHDIASRSPLPITTRRAASGGRRSSRCRFVARAARAAMLPAGALACSRDAITIGASLTSTRWRRCGWKMRGVQHHSSPPAGARACRQVDGIRIDHVDGLYDPASYLERLRAAAAALPGGLSTSGSRRLSQPSSGFVKRGRWRAQPATVCESNQWIVCSRQFQATHAPELRTLHRPSHLVEQVVYESKRTCWSHPLAQNCAY